MAATPIDLITLERAKLAFPSVVDNSQDVTIQTLIGAASRAIERHCRRVFAATSYDEIYDSDGSGSLLLRAFPVLSVSRLAMVPSPVCNISNTSPSSAVQRAIVQTTLAANTDWPAASTGITLTRVALGVTTVDATLTWANYTTVQAVVNAINALGNGWSATVAAGMGGWPSADINAIQGAMSCLSGSGAQLMIHTQDVGAFDLTPETGEVRFSGNLGTSIYGTGWLPGSYAVDLLPGVSLPRGNRNLRIAYTAGFANLPMDVGYVGPLASVAHACALQTAHMFSNPAAAGNLLSESLGDYSYTRTGPVQGLLSLVKELVEPFRDFRV